MNPIWNWSLPIIGQNKEMQLEETKLRTWDGFSDMSSRNLSNSCVMWSVSLQMRVMQVLACKSTSDPGVRPNVLEMWDLWIFPSFLSVWERWLHNKMCLNIDLQNISVKEHVFFCNIFLTHRTQRGKYRGFHRINCIFLFRRCQYTKLMLLHLNAYKK